MEYLQLHNVTFRKKRWYIGKEIRNMFQKVLDYYLKSQNGRIKHDYNLDNINEVEFVFSLSMIFIRVLIKSNNKLR